MSSVQHKNHLQLIKIIITQSFTSFIICDHCFSLVILYFVIFDYSDCSECVYYDCLCISVLLESLNCTYLYLKFNINDVINEYMKQTIHLFKLNTKIICLFKTLKQNKSWTLIKVCCVAKKLDDNINEVINDEKNSENIANLNSLIKLMNSNFFINSEFSSQIAEAFLHN